MPGDIRIGIRLTAEGAALRGEVERAQGSLRGFTGETRSADAAARRLARTSGQLEAAVRGSGSAFARAHGRVASYAGSLVGVAGAVRAVRSVVSATVRQEQALAQVEARIRSTGGAAGVTAQEVAEMAAAFQTATTFGDEEILEAQSLLLSFRNVAGEAFGDATEAMLNLAAGMRTDLRSAAVQLGRALDDPKRGLDALSRSGTTFSPAQRELIKRLADTGRVAEAQRVILAELEKQYGDSARAARETLGGALDALGNAFGDLLEVEGSSTESLRLGIESLTEAVQGVDVESLHASLAALGQVAGVVAAVIGGRAAIALGVWATRSAAAAVRAQALSVAAAGAAARVDVARLRMVAGARTARRFGGALRYASVSARLLNRALLTGPLGIGVAVAYGIYELATAANDAAEGFDAAAESAEAFEARLRSLDGVRLGGLETEILESLDAARTAAAEAQAELAEANRRLAAARDATARIPGATLPAVRAAAEGVLEDARRAAATAAATAADADDAIAELEARLARVRARLEGAEPSPPDRPGPESPPGDAEANARAIETAIRRSNDAIARLTLTRIELVRRAERAAVEELEALRGQAGVDEETLQRAITARTRQGVQERLAIYREASERRIEEQRRREEAAAEARRELAEPAFGAEARLSHRFAAIDAEEARRRALIGLLRDQAEAERALAHLAVEAAAARAAAVEEERDRRRRTSTDLATAASVALEDFAAGARTTAKDLQDGFTRAFRGAEDAIVQFVTKGKIEFAGLAQSILADLARIAVRQSITGPLASALAGAFGGAGGGTAPLSGSLTGRALAHGGGVAGTLGGRRRLVPDWVFAGAPRLHDGGYIGRGEVPAILRRGEGVFTPEQMARLGPGGPMEISIEVENTGTPQAMEVDRVWTDRDNRHVIRLVASDAADGGDTARALSARFGLGRPAR